MFLPIFLFFLYFALYFLQNHGAVMAAVANQTKDRPIAGLETFQTIFYYVLASVFLIGGTITAMKASMFSGTGVVSVAKWSRGVAARRLGITGAQMAAREKLAKYRGAKAARRSLRRTTDWSWSSPRYLGVRGGNLKHRKILWTGQARTPEIQSQYDIGQDHSRSEWPVRPIVLRLVRLRGLRIGNLRQDGTTDPRTFESTLKGLG